MLSRKRIVLVCAATAALGIVAAPAASANGHSSKTDHKKGWSRTLTTDVLLPFGMAVANDGTVYVADGAKDAVFRLDGGALTFLAAGLPNTAPDGAPPNADVAGIDVADDGSWAYTTSRTDAMGNHTDAQLIIKRAGKPDVVADLLAYENTKNPDQKNTYGLEPGPGCEKGRTWLAGVTGGPATYSGIKDSHPYAVASLGNGSWAVADAGGNDILKVNAKGDVSTISVLPPQKVTITQALLQSASVDPQTGQPVDVPDYANCLVGKSYGFEPVPTDVEVGPFGQFWVSTLPGGPEDPSLGARGSVYLVNPQFGWSWRLATGFAGATNLAVTKEGTTYVSELFGNKITKVSLWGSKSTFQNVNGPLALETKGNFVYAALNGLDLETGSPNNQGAIIKYRR